MRALVALATAAAILVAGSVRAQIGVTVEGSVSRPGEHELGTRPRLLDAVKAAGIRAEAYLHGAAWLHRAEIAPQRELKAGVLFDLAVLEQEARLDGDAARIALVARLRDQLRAMPLTGRRVNTLDPVRLELEPRSNRVVSAGDRLLFPVRPDTVSITGAVRADCVLPFVGLRGAAGYVADCPRHADADADWLYVIQPDGQVLRRGIALWNRDHAQPLAPGARIFVPLRADMLRERAERLNGEFAAFLATQVLEPVGVAQ